jgi:hypothetical protein
MSKDKAPAAPVPPSSPLRHKKLFTFESDGKTHKTGYKTPAVIPDATAPPPLDQDLLTAKILEAITAATSSSVAEPPKPQESPRVNETAPSALPDSNTPTTIGKCDSEIDTSDESQEMTKRIDFLVQQFLEHTVKEFVNRMVKKMDTTPPPAVVISDTESATPDLVPSPVVKVEDTVMDVGVTPNEVFITIDDDMKTEPRKVSSPPIDIIQTHVDSPKPPLPQGLSDQFPPSSTGAPAAHPEK